MKVLFFSRENDELSSKCLNHLVGLGYKVDAIFSNKRKEKLSDDLRGTIYDYIICYRSYLIIPKFLLDKTKYYNINFHPASPNYPGSGGVNLALLNEDQEFGVTAHLMNEKVDSGDIIEYRSFKVNKIDNVQSLLDRTHNYLYCLFIELTTQLRQEGNEIIKSKIKQNKIKWSKSLTKISDIDKLQVIEKDVTEIELEKRIRSCNHPNFPLEVHIHNHRFVYKGKILSS